VTKIVTWPGKVGFLLLFSSLFTNWLLGDWVTDGYIVYWGSFNSRDSYLISLTVVRALEGVADDYSVVGSGVPRFRACWLAAVWAYCL